MTRQMRSVGRGKQDRRGRPSPFGHPRLTIPDPRLDLRSNLRPDPRFDARQAPEPSQERAVSQARAGEEAIATPTRSIAEDVGARQDPRSSHEAPGTEAPQALDAPEKLMERVCQGDHAAFARLYDQFSGPAFGLALRVCNDRAVAEDAVQEAFLSLWRRPTGYRPDRGSVSTYLLTLVHHRAVDAVRHEQRLRIRERASAVGEQIENDEELIEAASVSGLRERVRAALAQLTNRQRQALELAYFSGLTVSDVAKRLDIPLGTAKTRVRDGMIRLRSLLASEGEPG